MRYFVLNNVDSRDYGYALTIEREMLPPIDPIQMTVPRRAGVYIPKKRSRDIGSLGFTIRYGVIGSSRADFRSKVRAVAEWLFNLNRAGEAAPIWISDEPSRIYKVWLYGQPNFDDFLDTGEISFTLIAPDPFADSTAISTATFETAAAANLITGGHDSFETFTAGAAFRNSTIAVIDTAHAKSGSKALKINIQSGNNNFVFLGASDVDYNQPVTAGQTYIFSFWVYAEAPVTVQSHVKFNTATPESKGSSQISIPAGEWTRHTQTVTAPAGATACVLRVDLDTAWLAAWYDEIQFEAATAGQTLPSAWKPAGAAGYKVEIFNDGTHETFPYFRIVPTADLTYLRVGNGKGEFIYLGTGRTYWAWTPIIIDHKKGEVYFETTKASLMNWLSPDSRFFKLEPKTTYSLTMEANAGATMTGRVDWQQKYI